MLYGREQIGLRKVELRIGELTDPIDTENTIAKLEEKIRRQLSATGTLKARDLKKAVNAHRVGIWAFDRAIHNLRSAGEIRLNTDWTFSLMGEECRQNCRQSPSQK